MCHVVEKEAFADCRNLLRLEIQNGITIKDNAFRGCDSLSVLIVDKNSPFRNPEELKRIGITHELKVITHDEYEKVLVEFKNEHPALMTHKYTDRQIELFYCLLLPNKTITLKQFADIFSKEQEIPSCIAVKIPEIDHGQHHELTKVILEHGMFSKREIERLNVVARVVSFEMALNRKNVMTQRNLLKSFYLW